MIREKIAALPNHEVITLRQQLADSEAARKAETTVATAEINRLKQAAVTREAEYRNAILDRDQARDTAADLRRQLDSEKKNHEESRDGFEKSFRDTVSSLEVLKNSHSLTRQALENKEAELAESQNAHDNMKKVLSSTRAALKESRDEAAQQAQVLESFKKNYETSKKNCSRLKDAYEKAKEAALVANTALTKILDMSVPEKDASRPLGDRIATFADDLKARTSQQVKTFLARVPVVLKNIEDEVNWPHCQAGRPGVGPGSLAYLPVTS
ncbi:hypothetical protein U9M48_043252 [Paspalum notatum var. saurae]|uniref:Uncharacterized protein n=1 Tax=Paspalum notatum var. saurae TaxID=547442 RepID=A0AAQ3XGB5_PASNO